MDLYLDRLTSQVHTLDEEIALHDALCSAQAQETKALKEALSNTSTELEVCVLLRVCSVF